MTNCPICGRDPAKANDEAHECSHVDCPSRRHCWSDGTPPPSRKPREIDPDIARLFDTQD